MIVSRDLAINVFKKVKHIREEYRQTVLAGDANVISIEDLQWVVERMYDLKIEKRLVPFVGEFIRGMVERWADRLLVSVRAGQSVEYTRFTAVKEICHGVIDEKEDWSTHGTETLSDVLNENLTSKPTEMAARATQSELFAELAAVELLYPYDCRVADKQKLELGTTTIVKIATYHKLPAAVVTRALSKGHFDFAEMIWAELSKATAA